MANPEFLTVQEVARIVRRSADTILTAISNGHLEAVRIGRKWNITTTAVENWIKAGGKTVEPKSLPEGTAA